jgi:hypothetical protein
MAVVLPFDVPDGLVMPAADCLADFDAVCGAIQATQHIRYITYSKKLKKPKLRYRCVGIELSNGKFATLLKMDNENYFQIWLQRSGYGFHLDEIEEVRDFMQVSEHEIKRLDNGLSWIQK